MNVAGAAREMTCSMSPPPEGSTRHGRGFHIEIRRGRAHRERASGLVKDAGDAPRLSGADRAARLGRLERLLFDVRAGRTSDFTMPTANGEVRIFVTAD
jgi:hypothetical protein